MTIHPIDLHHRGRQGMICSFLLLDEEPTLVDPGPSTTLRQLRTGLAEHGLRVRDLRHVLLTHVHMDHSGSTGHLVAEHPGLAVHVHLDGLPHMADPSRLVAASRAIWGDDLDVFWGEMRPVPVDALRPWVPGSGGRHPVRSVRPLATPGHIGHHVAYLHEADGTLLVGDSLGVLLAEDAPTHPKSPPPAVDLEAWRATLAEVRGLGVERAAFAHFGIHQDVATRTYRMEAALADLEGRVLDALDADDAEERARAFREDTRVEMEAQLPADLVQRYIETFDPVADWHGMERYVRHQASTL
jgi:glyoxylase-like metal-dependent hydrolase (beta-lactamase superfamily II)